MFGNFIEALRFAADKHTTQRRKGCEDIPYINHPIKVVELLCTIGRITDFEILSATILHDVLEDTCTTQEEMTQLFGERITRIVVEVTDDMTQTYEERKRTQIRKAPSLSPEAKVIKIADKMVNIRDMLTIPVTWSNRRKRTYVEWSEKVVAGCRGINPMLDRAFDDICAEAKVALIGI